MSDETDSSQPGKGRPGKKVSLRTLIVLASDAFPFVTEHLGPVQGRSLSGAMETALVERLPPDDQLSDREVAQVFMGCTCGVAEEPNTPVFKPLTPEQVDQLTYADVGGFARDYLEKVAKQPAQEDAIAGFAAVAREQRRRIAEDLAKHGKDVRESMRSLSANSSIMQNWQALQEAVQGPALRMQREFERAMGPASRATDAIRDALAAIQRPAMATDAIRDFIEAERTRADHLRSIEDRLQADMDAYRRDLDLVSTSTVERLRRELEGPAASAVAELQRQLANPVAKALDEMKHQLEGPAATALAEMQRQLDSARDVAVERIRTDLEHLPDDIGADSNEPETLELELPRLPSIHESPLGRTALAVEGLREASGRMEAAMGVIVNQAGKASDLISNVSGTIQTEAREFQSQSDRQTKKAMSYARFSLIVAAVALGVSAWFSWLGYNADRAEARTQGLETKAVIEQLREQNGQLGALVAAQRITSQRQSPAANQTPSTSPIPAPSTPGGKGRPKPQPAAKPGRP